MAQITEMETDLPNEANLPHLELKTIRVDREKHTDIYFAGGNRAGTNIVLGPTGDMILWRDFSGTLHKIHSRTRPAIEWPDGAEAWVQEGLYHRRGGPAMDNSLVDGQKNKYYLNGVELSIHEHDEAISWGLDVVREGSCTVWVKESTAIPHRMFGPARIWESGQADWMFNGLYHNSQGPARLYPDGSYSYYEHGLLHRTNGPATESGDGSQGWFKKGNIHREPQDGPAITHSDGTIEYWLNGKRHNPYGAAIVYNNNEAEYWIDGKNITHSEWQIKIAEHKNLLISKIKSQMKAQMVPFIGVAKTSVTDEEITDLVKKHLELIMFDIKKTEQFRKNTTQLDLNLPEVIGNEEIPKIDEEPEISWKLTAGAMLVAAGVKAFSMTSSEATYANVETLEMEKEWQ